MTIRLTDEEFALATRTEAPPKLSRVPPGHWRCVFAVPDFATVAKAEPLGDGLWRSFFRHPSREVAEEAGHKSERGFNAWFEANGCPPEFRFVRAEYFPGERP